MENKKVKTFAILIGCLFLVGCASVTYRNGQQEMTYSRWGSQSIKGLMVEQTSNGLKMTVESAQSESQAIAQTMVNLSNLAAKAAK